MGLEVLGAAWGRTGTLSVKVALERLGFGPTYHMLEVFRTHPEHRRTWIEAARGEAVDWDRLFGDYRSAVDWPACAFWSEIIHAFPDVRVVLVERDPDRWFESFDATVRYGIPTAKPPGNDDTATMMWEVISGRSFGHQTASREEIISSYQAHRQRVLQEAPQDRLLRWSLRDGWQPICEFLGLEEPAEPFPRVNDRLDFHRIFVEGGDVMPERDSP